MSITKVTSNTLASGAALSNLNQESSILLTKNVSISGSISSSSATISGNLTAGNLVVDVDTLVVDNVNSYVGIGTSTPTATLEVNGSTIIQDDAIFNGTENTAPNQTLTGGAGSIITKELSLRNQINESFSSTVFSSTGENPTNAAITQTNFFAAGGQGFSTAALSGYLNFHIVLSTLMNYAQGSGGSFRFSDKWTMFFEYDTNNFNAVDADFYVNYGSSSGTVMPTASDRCILVKHNQLRDQIEAIVYDGTGTPQTSGPVAVAPIVGITNSLSSKDKICIVWDGSSLFVYMARWLASSYGNNSPFTFYLIAQVNTTALPTSMTSYNCFFQHILNQDNPPFGLSNQFQAPMFIRKAVHPI